MKVTLLVISGILILVAGTFAANSPTDQGSNIIGGTAYISVEKGEDASLTTVYLMPSVGYFISPRFMLGVTISLISLSSGGNSSTAFGAGPEIRYYFPTTRNEFGEIRGSMYPFLGAFLSHLGEPGGYNNGTTQMGGFVGFDQMLSEQIALEAQFRIFGTSYGGDESTTTFYLGAGLTAFLY